MNTKSKSKKSRKQSMASKFLNDLIGEPLTLGNLICSIREGEDMSMAEFAEELGISRSHLNDIEKGRTAVSPQKAAEYAEILGYSEKQFVRLALQDLLNRYDLEFEVELHKRRA